MKNVAMVFQEKYKVFLDFPVSLLNDHFKTLYFKTKFFSFIKKYLEQERIIVVF